MCTRNKDGAVAREAATRLDWLLNRTTHDVGAHIGVTYLQVPERQLLQMTTVTGVPSRLAGPWARLALAAPAPVPEAVRSQRPVWSPTSRNWPVTSPAPLSPFPTPLPCTSSRW